MNDIELGDVIATPLTPDVAVDGTAILSLRIDLERSVLVILGNTRDDLVEMVGLLRSGEFKQGLLSGTLGIYQVSGTPIDLLAPPAGE